MALKSFYNWLMSKKNSKENSEFQDMIFQIWLDKSFPKNETSFDELTIYLEEQAQYRISMLMFDDAYQQYLLER